MEVEGYKRIKDVDANTITFEDDTIIGPWNTTEIYTDPQYPNKITWGTISSRKNFTVNSMLNPEIRDELIGKYVKVNNVGGRSSRKKKINKSSKRSKALKSSKRARTHRNRRQRN